MEPRTATSLRTNCRNLMLGLLIAAACGSVALADDAPDVRKLMSAEEFEAAGIGKLEPAELDALNRWLLRYTAKDAPEVRRSSEQVQEEIRKVDDAGTRTQIVGDFRGWSGNTVFRLKNGQVWKQRIGGRWFYRATDPEVLIRKNRLGFWEMTVVEADRSVGVTRVE
jgi:hypothetical protein